MEQVEQVRDELLARRRRLALALREGEAEAAQELERVEQELRALAREEVLDRLAIEGAIAREDEERAQAEREARAALVREKGELAAARRTALAAVDAALEALVPQVDAALELDRRFEDVRQRLGETGGYGRLPLRLVEVVSWRLEGRLGRWLPRPRPGDRRPLVEGPAEGEDR